MSTIYGKYDEGLHKAMRQPFPPEYIEWKPQVTPKQGEEGWGLAVPYVDPRWYMERLDTLVGPWGWTSEIIPVNPSADKIIVKLVILAVEKMNIGEKDGGGISVATSAYAQGFKRACVEFGLGRYLYGFVPQTWVKMEKKGQATWVYTAEAQARLRVVAEAGTKDYLDYLGGDAGTRQPSTGNVVQFPAQQRQTAPAPAPTQQQAAPAPEQQAPSGSAALIGDSYIPELNFRIKARGKAAEYTGISSGEIMLHQILSAGDQGLGYLRWMASKWNDESGKAAAGKVVAWHEDGGQLPGAEPAPASPLAQPPAPQSVDIAPVAGIDVSTITDMNSLCAALGTEDRGLVWGLLTARGGPWRTLPKPTDTEAWIEGYEYIKAKSGTEVPF